MSRGQGWAAFLEMAMEPTTDINAPTFNASASHQSRSASTRSQSHSQSASMGADHMNFNNNEPSFDLEKWFPAYQSCQTYFVDKAQWMVQVQAVAAFANIRLPFQQLHNPINRIGPSTPYGAIPHASNSNYHTPQQNSQNPTALPFVSLFPYLRRLIVTGFDSNAILHGFFGSDWRAGVGPLHEIERRNFMFHAKAGGWAEVKKVYDMIPDETVPFMKPLQETQLAEIDKGNKHWSAWLAMEDWMLGPMAPEEGYGVGEGRSTTDGDIKSEEMMH